MSIHTVLDKFYSEMRFFSTHKQNCFKRHKTEKSVKLDVSILTECIIHWFTTKTDSFWKTGKAKL